MCEYQSRWFCILVVFRFAEPKATPFLQRIHPLADLIVWHPVCSDELSDILHLVALAQLAMVRGRWPQHFVKNVCLCTQTSFHYITAKVPGLDISTTQHS